MTKEQQLQYALKQALTAAFSEVEDYDITIHGILLNNSPLSGDDSESYPAIIINTAFPVPAGHKSAILDVQCEITVMSYMPDDLKRQSFASIKEILFNTLHDTEDWSEFEYTTKTVDFNTISIESSSEPETSGMLIVQPIKCIIHAENK